VGRQRRRQGAVLRDRRRRPRPDPNFLLNRGQWDQSDIDEIATQIGPFFGNSVFSRSYDWHADYRYYTLYEAFEKLADVFQERERFEAMNEIHEEFQADLAPVVPGQSERPEAPVLWAGGTEPEEFFPYVQSEGTSFKHLRDLGVRDSLASSGVGTSTPNAAPSITKFCWTSTRNSSSCAARSPSPPRSSGTASSRSCRITQSPATSPPSRTATSTRPARSTRVRSLTSSSPNASPGTSTATRVKLFDRQAVADVVTGDF